MLACNYPSQAAATWTVVPIPPTVTPSPVPATLPPNPSPDPTSTPPQILHPFPLDEEPAAMFEYTTLAGDTLEALALRFGVEPALIMGGSPLSASGYLSNGLILQIPNVLEAISPGGGLLSDGELVFSPTAADFDASSFIGAAAGYLSRHSETLVDDSVLSGAAIVQRVADENSVNPRLLLALIEERSGWVYGGAPANADALLYPLGFSIPDRRGLYQELSVAATQLNRGYYGWRLGTLVGTTDRGWWKGPVESDVERRVGGCPSPVHAAPGRRPVSGGCRRPGGVCGKLSVDVRRRVEPGGGCRPDRDS